MEPKRPWCKVAGPPEQHNAHSDTDADNCTDIGAALDASTGTRAAVLPAGATADASADDRHCR